MVVSSKFGSLTGFACLAALAASGAWAKEGRQPDIALNGSWQVSMDAQGKVLDLVAHNRLKPVVNTKIEEAIRAWRFVPGSINGAPAPTQSELELDMTAVPAADDTIAIRIDDARLGGRMNLGKMPAISSRLMAKRPNGMVVIRVEYDADGKVTAATRESDAPDVLPELADYALRAARGWTFEPERVGGRAIPGSIVTPLCMTTEIRYSYESRAPKAADKPCRWKRSGEDKWVAEGHALALDPAARIASDIVGKTL